MNNEFVIKDLAEEEKETVRRLLIESYQQYEREYRDPQVWTDYMQDIMSSVDNPHVDKILVAKEDQTILGSLQLFQSSEKAYDRPELQISSPIIRLLAVHPSARGRGVAQALLKAGITYAKSLGATNLYLHTSDSMNKAIQLYEWFGFQRDQTKEFNKSDFLVKCYRLDLCE